MNQVRLDDTGDQYRIVPSTSFSPTGVEKRTKVEKKRGQERQTIPLVDRIIDGRVFQVNSSFSKNYM